MAKTGFWLQGAKGKFAGAALQKGAFGGTIMRQITTPKNPRSVPQMVQRVCTSTISHAYSALKEICDHSFEGVTYGAQSMAYFRKINSKKLTHLIERNTLDGNYLEDIFFFNVKGDKVMMPIQQLQVSEGTLPSIRYDVVSTYTPHGGGSEETLPQPSFRFLSPEGNIYSTGDAGALAADYNLKDGDQITFVILTSKGFFNSMDVNDSFVPTLSVKFERVIFNESSSLVDSQKHLFGNSHLTATLDEYQVEGETVKDIVGVCYDDQPVVSIAVIVSRKVDGEWKRSTAFMRTFADNDGMAKDDATWLFNNISKTGRSLYDAIQSYYGESADVPSDYYLNNARA